MADDQGVVDNTADAVPFQKTKFAVKEKGVLREAVRRMVSSKDLNVRTERAVVANLRAWRKYAWFEAGAVAVHADRYPVPGLHQLAERG